MVAIGNKLKKNIVIQEHPNKMASNNLKLIHSLFEYVLDFSVSKKFVGQNAFQTMAITSFSLRFDLK